MLNQSKIRALGSFFIWILLVGLSVNLIFRASSRLRVHATELPRKPASLHPFTAILNETVYDSSGHAIPGVTNTWALRSDGSTAVRMEVWRDGAKVTSQRNVWLSSGLRTELDELHQTKTTTTYPDDGRNGNWARDPNTTCTASINGEKMGTDETLAGIEQVLDYKSAKITKGSSMTFWYALDFGCALVKFDAQWGGLARSDQELVTLLPGDPAPALFNAPGQFNEVPPSKMHPGALPADAARRLDQHYYAHHLN